MYRLFNTHNIRQTISLPEMWNIQTLDGDEQFTGRLPVPSCIESIPQLSSYKGRCKIWTSCTFGGDVRLTFKGVSHTAQVSFNQQSLGSHYGAYGEFSFIMKNQPYDNHVISVTADNSYSEESSLHKPNDYYSYCGITRPVMLEKINQAYIRWVHITPVHRNDNWKIEVTVSIENIQETSKTVTLHSALSISDTTIINQNQESALPEITVSDIVLEASSTNEVSFTVDCPDVSVYHPDKPTLYYLHNVVSVDGEEIDDLIDRFGFREISVREKDILWNGVPIRIKGFNRHEDYAEFGCSIPLAAMHRDLMLIKNTGANCIRTCHYPNDERFLDLCDEYGLYVWEESHARGLSEEQMRNPHFIEQSRLSIDEMITCHYNHPSIFVWGLLNECASDTEYGRECYETLISQIRSLDSSRPVTFASCRYDHDLCLELVDIVSYNFYPGWYHKRPCSEFLEERLKVIEGNGGAGKPFIVSEIGAGAIYGYRTNTCCKWSEDYQAIVLKEQIGAVMSLPGANGVILWQFADCRVDEDWFSTRPKTQNNKGIVDMYRREKMGYGAVREAFAECD